MRGNSLVLQEKDALSVTVLKTIPRPIVVKGLEFNNMMTLHDRPRLTAFDFGNEDLNHYILTRADSI